MTKWTIKFRPGASPLPGAAQSGVYEVLKDGVFQTTRFWWTAAVESTPISMKDFILVGYLHWEAYQPQEETLDGVN